MEAEMCIVLSAWYINVKRVAQILFSEEYTQMAQLFKRNRTIYKDFPSIS